MNLEDRGDNYIQEILGNVPPPSGFQEVCDTMLTLCNYITTHYHKYLVSTESKYFVCKVRSNCQLMFNALNEGVCEGKITFDFAEQVLATTTAFIKHTGNLSAFEQQISLTMSPAETDSSYYDDSISEKGHCD